MTNLFRSIFDAGFQACRAYGDNHHHYRGEQADRVFAKAMEKLGHETDADVFLRVYQFPAKIRNPRLWQGMTKEVREHIAEELEKILGVCPAEESK